MREQPWGERELLATCRAMVSSCFRAVAVSASSCCWYWALASTSDSLFRLVRSSAVLVGGAGAVLNKAQAIVGMAKGQ